MKWISVEDGLPDENSDGVLLWSPTLEKDTAYPGYPMMVCNPIFAKNNPGLFTHWMPLPEPPTEGE